MTLSIQLIVFQFLLPSAFMISLGRGKFESKLEWIVQGLFTTLFISWIFFSSPWDWFSYYLRFAWLLVWIALLVYTWRNVKSLPFRSTYTRNQKWSLAIYTALLLIFGMYNVWIFSGYSADEEAVELAFPMKDGMYYVGQGGNHTQINYHNTHPAQKYAVDLVELNTIGARASGIYPKNLDAYHIYGESLYSPCTGKVGASRNNLSDLTPPETNAGQPKGMQIDCESQDVQVLVAHMQEESVAVEEGDSVQQGDPIGVVGNSGNTTEPHLHIHAVRDGEGVPMQFNGRFLVRNDVVW
ncbi:M23 family metallopeptidase [Salibacterium salarium]|uniref:M23 family metallopeptidase n=1 Tax=Salibacterium salarium TaxID=284579 RepID=A0A428N602_9BACI|nr:M23 family metallopeptidase [Salibacterium salarium]RSL33923.1 M23 family metallopeptidase [Salibacterium salarium]